MLYYITFVPILTERNLDICPNAMSDIMYGIEYDWLDKNGFQKYLEVQGKNTVFGEGIFPPNGAKEVFMGCSATDATTIQLAAVMSYDELFDFIKYPYGEATIAKPARSFYTYYSNTSADPFGFTNNPNIFLSSYDWYDCKFDEMCTSNDADNHRLSVLNGLNIYYFHTYKLFYRSPASYLSMWRRYI